MDQPIITEELAPTDKRLVLEYTSGAMKGIFQIIGCNTEYSPHIPGPIRIGTEESQVVEFASLIRVTPKAVYYREVYSQVTGRLDDYMPEGSAPSFNKDQV